MALIRFRNTEGLVEVEANASLSLLNAILRSGAKIRHDCGGKALCGTCRVHVTEGGSTLSPVAERERVRLTSIGASADERLACQAYAVRDVSIEAP